ncbi:MAG: ActD protein [Myxococcota bacterium]
MSEKNPKDSVRDPQRSMGAQEDTPRAAPPPLLLERAQLGELDQVRRRALAAEFPDLDDRVVALEEQNLEALEQYPAAMMAARISEDIRRSKERRAKGARRARTFYGGIGSMALAGAAAAALAYSGALSPEQPVVASSSLRAEHQDTTRIKGEHLKLWRVRADGTPERLQAGARARAGDRLQVEYHGGGHTHGVIASVDGRGAVTLHFPASPESSTELARGSVKLGYAYELDDAPRYEQFFFVRSNRPLDVQAALDVLERTEEPSALRLPSDALVADILLEKEER